MLISISFVCPCYNIIYSQHYNYYSLNIYKHTQTYIETCIQTDMHTHRHTYLQYTHKHTIVYTDMHTYVEQTCIHVIRFNLSLINLYRCIYINTSANPYIKNTPTQSS